MRIMPNNSHPSTNNVGRRHGPTGQTVNKSAAVLCNLLKWSDERMDERERARNVQEERNIQDPVSCIWQVLFGRPTMIN